MKIPFATLALISLAPISIFAAPVARAEPAAEVKAAFNQVLAEGWFHAQAWGRIFGPDLPPVAARIEAILPGRVHVTTADLEFILLPGSAWTRALGVWVPTDASLLPVTGFDPAAMRHAIDSIHDVRLEGHAKMKTCTADVYRFRASGQLPGAQAGGDMRLWKCRNDGRPARLEATESDGNRITLIFDWSQPVAIGAP